MPIHSVLNQRSSLLVVGALATQVLGALSPEIIALARKYAPQFRLTPTEKYFPSSVEYMFPRYQVYNNVSEALATQPSPFTASNLNNLIGKGENTWLTVPDTNASYLTGLNPTSNHVPVYTFIVPKEGGVVDFFYWIFFPFNLGKNIIALGQVGDHIGDWERMTVRTVNGVAISADYNAHSSGNGAGTKLWTDVLKPPGEDRPLGYVAEGSHGVWPEPGTWVYQDLLVVQLKDETADGGKWQGRPTHMTTKQSNSGPIWHAKDNIYPIEYLPNGAYTGDQGWLNYQGIWGNKGQTDCWWHSIVETCALSDGPGGPYRQDVLGASTVSSHLPLSKFSHMKGPHSQTLAPLAGNSITSMYRFRLDSSTSGLIDLGSFKYVAVEQRCLQTPTGTTGAYNYGFSTLTTDGDREYTVNRFLFPVAHLTQAMLPRIGSAYALRLNKQAACGLLHDSFVPTWRENPGQGMERQ
ncbi:Vacuolar protein sorting-associated protein 62 [Ceratobasidium sp. 392]|nr:Vacuolar protein sorting-associated protein 62 [Ceratobasidium sp. 392]